MDHNLLKNMQTDSAARAGGAASTKGPDSNGTHSSHRTRQARIRGLIMDLPGSDVPVEVCVNDQADWELIYKNRALHVKCLIHSCDTLLTAKRMSRSGLRFLAVRSGGCDHNLVEMPVEYGEVEQDPSALAGGGGPEGVEHLWIKGRLYRILRTLGLEAEIENSHTRADVYLPKHRLVLEYQRWNTDFTTRTQQRTSAGAARTIWLFPSQLPDDTPRALRKTFDKEVFQNGGIYVSVLNPTGDYEPQRPWQHASQERTARLFASGSIVEFDFKMKALVRSRRSLATVLDQIVRDQRILEQTDIWKRSEMRFVRAFAWVLREDLALARAAREGRQHLTQPIAARSKDTQPRVEEMPQPQPQPQPVPPGDEPRISLAEPPTAPAVEHLPSRTKAATDEVTTPTPEATSPVPVSTGMAPDTRQPWWKALADWFRSS